MKNEGSRKNKKTLSPGSCYLSQQCSYRVIDLQSVITPAATVTARLRHTHE